MKGETKILGLIGKGRTTDGKGKQLRSRVVRGAFGWSMLSRRSCRRCRWRDGKNMVEIEKWDFALRQQECYSHLVKDLVKNLVLRSRTKHMRGIKYHFIQSIV